MFLCRILIFGIIYTLNKLCTISCNKSCILVDAILCDSKGLKILNKSNILNPKFVYYKNNKSTIGNEYKLNYLFVCCKIVNGNFCPFKSNLNSVVDEDNSSNTTVQDLDLDDWNDHRLIDLCEITVSGGDGGDGCLSFRREKHVPLGGANGGNGGPGGDVYIKCDTNVRDLKNFHYGKIYRAENGTNGRGSNRNGAKGKDLCLCVPPGTVVHGENDEIYSTLLNNGDKVRIARGGRGGKGNRHFMTRLNNAPRICERGEAGIVRKIKLVFKKPSDIALVGKPNSGKSSIIKQLTNAKPRVANFPFSTRFPIHGVLQFQNGGADESDSYDSSEDEEFLEEEYYDETGSFDEYEDDSPTNSIASESESVVSNTDLDIFTTNRSDDYEEDGDTINAEDPKHSYDSNIVKNLLIVDIPGLIAGSSSGRGLGHDFLRHIERCKIISYVIDSNLQDPLADYLDVKREIGTYDSKLLKKPEIILLNKIDLIDNERMVELMNSFIKECNHDRIYFLSAKTRENIDFISLLFNQIYSECILNNSFDIYDDHEKDDYNEDKNDKGDISTDNSGNSSRCNIENLDEFRNLSKRFKIEHDNGVFTLKSPYLERKVKMMRFELPETLDRFRNILKANKITRKLLSLGIKPGNVLRIGDVSFTVQTDEFFI